LGVCWGKIFKGKIICFCMVMYSHSRVSCFENCPYQYKLKYIDRIKVDVPTTIEMFMGSRVHDALEDLYKRKKFKQRVSKESLIKFYRELWARKFSDDILIVKKHLTAKNYFKMGEKFISDYYDKYKPFEQMTILGLETKDRMTLPDGNQWHIMIDKLGCDDKGNYFVCDYKTNARMKDQDEADEDRQLAMYSIWVKDKFDDVKSVKLIWHMLAFGKDAVSERSDEQLKKLQDDICKVIKKMETATEFPRKQSGLCNYCVYKEMCPSFKHEVELEKKKVKEFKEDEGVKLVDEFSEIKTKLSELKKKDEEFRNSLIAYAKQFGVDAVYGSNKVAKVKEFDKVVLPEDREKFIELLKKKGVWDDFNMLSYFKINSGVLKGDVDEAVKKMVEIEKGFRVGLSRRKG